MQPSDAFRFGSFEADAATGELRREGARVRLPLKPFQALVALLERPGELVTREELRERLWGVRTVVDFDNGLNAAINKVREALADSAEHPRFIETLPRRGYRFVAPVERVEAGPTLGRRRIGLGVPAVLTAVVLVVMAGLWGAQAIVEGPGERTHLAVLPFENLGGPDQEYFSDGLTAELITELGRLRPADLGVIARTSAMVYKGTAATAGAIGAELGVDYLLEGSVRREGEQVRINAQLIEVGNQTQIWSTQYDRALTDVLQVQNEVARAVAAEISLRLPSVNETQAAGDGQVDPGAYDAYLRGQHLLRRRTWDSIQTGIEYLEDAVEADPAYAPAFAGLARAYELAASYGNTAPSALIPRAAQAVHDALELDPTLGEAYAVRGMIASYYQWRWREAGEDLQRAVALDPNSEFVHRQYSAYLSFMGDFDEAIRESERALELDPLSLIANANHGIILYRARRYDDAVAHLQRTLELDENYVLGHLDLGLVHAGAGRYDEAVAAFDKARVLSGDHPELIGLAGYARALNGARDRAREVLRELAALSEGQYVSPYVVALVHLGLGDKATALDWLERAYDDRVWVMSLLQVAPELDPLREEPRFLALLDGMGF